MLYKYISEKGNVTVLFTNKLCFIKECINNKIGKEVCYIKKGIIRGITVMSHFLFNNKMLENIST